MSVQADRSQTISPFQRRSDGATRRDASARVPMVGWGVLSWTGVGSTHLCDLVTAKGLDLLGLGLCRHGVG